MLAREGGRITANASVVAYNEITPENEASFHFHGGLDGFPLSGILAIPHDPKSRVLLMGRYEEPGLATQIVRPRAVMDELLETVLTIRSYVVAALATVAVATLATAALVFGLSLRLRRREIETLVKIGGSRSAVAAVLASEVVGVLGGFGAALAGLLTALVARFGSGAIRVFEACCLEVRVMHIIRLAPARSALAVLRAGGVRREFAAAGAHRRRGGEPLAVHAVSYPLAWLAERIGGEEVEVSFPAPPDVDPAFWSPDAATVAAYQRADIVFLNGAGYARWVQRAALPRSRLVDTGAAFEARWIPVDDAVTHGHGKKGEHTHGDFAPTFWLDPALAIEQARAIADALVRARPESQARIRARFEQLARELTAARHTPRSRGTAPGRHSHSVLPSRLCVPECALRPACAVPALGAGRGSGRVAVAGPRVSDGRASRAGAASGRPSPCRRRRRASRRWA